MEFEAQHILISGTPVGDLQIRYYGIIIVTAMLIAAWVAARLAVRRKLDPDHIWGGLTWAIFPGIIFARLWFVLFPPISAVLDGRDAAWYFQNFFNLNNGAIAVWSGGLHIFGAVLGGLIGAWLYFGPLHNTVARIFFVIFYPLTLVFEAIGWVFNVIYKRIRGQEVEPFALPKFETDFPDEGIPILPWLDIAGVTLPLAQAIGRWANFVNQELYGFPTELPWGIQIRDAVARVGEFSSFVEYPEDTRFHPLFLYESLWNLAAFFVLLRLYTRNADRFRPGDFFLLYLAQYSFIRFFLEFLRIEKAILYGINTSQVVTVVIFVLAVGLFLFRRTRPPQAATVPAAAAPAPQPATIEPADNPESVIAPDAGTDEQDDNDGAATPQVNN